MNRKQIGGVISTAIGFLLIILAVHAKNKVQEAKDVGDKIENFFTHNPSVWNPLIKFFGGAAQEALIGKYTAPILIALIAGILLAALGIGAVIHYRNR